MFADESREMFARGSLMYDKLTSLCVGQASKAVQVGLPWFRNYLFPGCRASMIDLEMRALNMGVSCFSFVCKNDFRLMAFYQDYCIVLNLAAVSRSILRPLFHAISTSLLPFQAGSIQVIYTQFYIVDQSYSSVSSILRFSAATSVASSWTGRWRCFPHFSWSITALGLAFAC